MGLSSVCLHRIKPLLYLELTSESVYVNRLSCNSLVSHSYRTRFISITKQDKQSAYKRNTEVRSCNNCCSGTAIRVTYSECYSVALVIEHINHMRRIIFISVACLPYFSMLSFKRHDFRKSSWA